MDVLLALVAVPVGLAVLGWLVSLTSWFRSRIRIVEGDNNYIRLWPNPGFRFGGWHWCKHYGQGNH